MEECENSDCVDLEVGADFGERGLGCFAVVLRDTGVGDDCVDDCDAMGSLEFFHCLRWRKVIGAGNYNWDDTTTAGCGEIEERF